MTLNYQNLRGVESYFETMAWRFNTLTEGDFGFGDCGHHHVANIRNT